MPIFKITQECPDCQGRGDRHSYCPACGTHTGTHWYDYCPPMPPRPKCETCKGSGTLGSTRVVTHDLPDLPSVTNRIFGR